MAKVAPTRGCEDKYHQDVEDKGSCPEGVPGLSWLVSFFQEFETGRATIEEQRFMLRLVPRALVLD